jgi:DNA topoisomerase VI subunit B
MLVNEIGITVTDNGPGIPPETVQGVLDFNVRVSSREAYVSPCRGAQGNALKTLVAMPFTLDGEQGNVEIEAHGVRHVINFRVDRVRQQPVIQYDPQKVDPEFPGTKILIRWPDSARSILDNAKARFLQIASDFTFLNPHLTLRVDWFGAITTVERTTDQWSKWLPHHPTSAHWYTVEQLERLIGAYVTDDVDRGRERTVREFVAEFRGLTGSAKQKQVLGETELARAKLTDLTVEGSMRTDVIGKLLVSMKKHSKPIKPADLGAIGKEHFAARMDQLGCVKESFGYQIVKESREGLPCLIETAFAWRGKNAEQARRLVTGVNWSAAIINPFRMLGSVGHSLDTVLANQRANEDEPIIMVVHAASPFVQYTDRGKSAVVVI